MTIHAKIQTDFKSKRYLFECCVTVTSKGQKRLIRWLSVMVLEGQPIWKLLPWTCPKRFTLTSHSVIWERRSGDGCSCHMTCYLQCLQAVDAPLSLYAFLSYTNCSYWILYSFVLHVNYVLGNDGIIWKFVCINITIILYDSNIG